ncbi:hypothetical protein [Chroococcidiopsis sp [FACHB-1243]]|uniref:Eco57I restriction-modification methylase domain-containing protein n=1 Tax=Chroococcidiopsis sp. [FACHB-1243] TaxID=2692781 RepID=UPI001F54E9A8|nr:hypothetical protein [Chroococcidiopsis sp. [FACHB-1243]]
MDLCKVALWIEGFPGKLPLNFLDHRIKCGNSLVGVLDLDCLQEGIPDEAYKAVTGDDKKLSTQLKKQNKKERENKDQLSLFGDLEPERTQYAESWRELGEIAETTPQEVKDKEKRYQETRKNQRWWQDYSACNLWTAAFFTPLTEQNLQLLPTTAVLTQLLRGNTSTQEIVEAANKLAQEKHFFHWCLEFPEVFEVGGFDCVLGNPPWERIKLQEKEFFASRSAEIANAENKAAREKLIKELPKKNLDLAQAFEEAKHDAEAQSKFIRESMRFPLTAVGDINTYAVFAETTRKLISPDGRVGVIVPTGIATDDTCKKFFGDLTQKQALASLYDFENRDKLFSAVDSRMKFSLVAISGKPIKQGNFAFFLTQPRQSDNPARLFQLSPQDIALLNPNTLTCPVFRSCTDAELTKRIYQNNEILLPESQKGSHTARITRMFDMNKQSDLFKSSQDLKIGFKDRYGYICVNKLRYLPLVNGKSFDAYDHRYATQKINKNAQIRTGTAENIALEEHQNINFLPDKLLYISEDLVDRWSNGRLNRKWILALMNVTSSTNHRTVIASLLPDVATDYSVRIVIFEQHHAVYAACLLGLFNSISFDYITRQKIQGLNLSDYITYQLAVPSKEKLLNNQNFIIPRVLELVYTAWDMQPFAQDMEYDGEPFIWNPNRRALLRAELDAYYAKLYGLTRDELRYILDPTDVYGSDFPSETFRVLKNNEIKQFGEYRTQRLVLEAWDRMFG